MLHSCSRGVLYTIRWAVVMIDGAALGLPLRRCLATQKCLKKYKGSVRKMSAKQKKARAKCLAKARKRK